MGDQNDPKETEETASSTAETGSNSLVAVLNSMQASMQSSNELLKEFVIQKRSRSPNHEPRSKRSKANPPAPQRAISPTSSDEEPEPEASQKASSSRQHDANNLTEDYDKVSLFGGDIENDEGLLELNSELDESEVEGDNNSLLDQMRSELPTEQRKQLLKKFKKPSNCDKVLCPKVNEEIWEGLQPSPDDLSKLKHSQEKVHEKIKDLKKQELTSDPQILNTVVGETIDFVSEPVQSSYPPNSICKEHVALAEAEINSLMNKGAIIPCDHELGEFISPIFTVPKKDGKINSPDRQSSSKPTETINDAEEDWWPGSSINAQVPPLLELRSLSEEEEHKPWWHGNKSQGPEEDQAMVNSEFKLWTRKSNDSDPLVDAINEMLQSPGDGSRKSSAKSNDSAAKNSPVPKLFLGNGSDDDIISRDSRETQAAITIQRWVRGWRVRRWTGQGALKHLLGQKKKEVLGNLAKSKTQEDLEEMRQAEKVKRREEKARLARQAAIEELQKKREEKKQENQRKAEDEMKFLQASGKVSKKKSNSRPKSAKPARPVSSLRLNNEAASASKGPSPSLPGSSRSTERKVDELFQEIYYCVIPFTVDEIDKDNEKPYLSVANVDSHNHHKVQRNQSKKSKSQGKKPLAADFKINSPDRQSSSKPTETINDAEEDWWPGSSINAQVPPLLELRSLSEEEEHKPWWHGNKSQGPEEDQAMVNSEFKLWTGKSNDSDPLVDAINEMLQSPGDGSRKSSAKSNDSAAKNSPVPKLFLGNGSDDDIISRDSRETQAAITIQRWVRGWRVRRWIGQGALKHLLGQKKKEVLGNLAKSKTQSSLQQESRASQAVKSVSFDDEHPLPSDRTESTSKNAGSDVNSKTTFDDLLNSLKQLEQEPEELLSPGIPAASDHKLNSWPNIMVVNLMLTTIFYKEIYYCVIPFTVDEIDKDNEKPYLSVANVDSHNHHKVQSDSSTALSAEKLSLFGTFFCHVLFDRNIIHFLDEVEKAEEDVRSEITQVREEAISRGLPSPSASTSITFDKDHQVEIKKQKEVILAAEKLRREKWITEKTQQIKEVTVKGLEPDIQKLIAKHKAEVKKIKSVHQ
ncbi:predicted protein, partial [Nematostella vectensis]